jgi:uncharacterized protein (AIM24 family)
MRSSLFDPQHAVTPTSDRFTLQSRRMLRAVLGPDLLALKGAVAAYQGDVEFDDAAPHGMGRFVRRLVAAEDTPLMRVHGSGEVYFANRAQDIVLITLEGDGISVNGTNVLAFDAELSSDVHRAPGAGISTGGLFTTSISGHGTVALTFDGEPLLLDCGRRPTHVDVQAAVAWSAGLEPHVVSTMNVGSLLRDGSGEALQYSFHGEGFVAVQPSEGEPRTTVQPGS